MCSNSAFHNMLPTVLIFQIFALICCGLFFLDLRKKGNLKINKNVYEYWKTSLLCTLFFFFV